jgi:hypothetical protein
MKVNPIIIIPVHKSEPTDFEIISFIQCNKILGHRQIKILAPLGIKLDKYLEFLPNSTELRVETVWMSSIRAYNKLMISPYIFYKLKDYSHILIHEPDAIVLNDELDYWCNQNYDYIGAPWFKDYDKAEYNSEIIGVGNFGFSLLRTNSLIKILSSRKRWYSLKRAFNNIFYGMLNFRGYNYKEGLKALGNGGKFKGAWQIYNENCDYFWSVIASKYHPNFNIAPYNRAVEFAWEVLPHRCLELSNGKLPFGIHAWAKYNLNFLKPIFELKRIDLSKFC